MFAHPELTGKEEHPSIAMPDPALLELLSSEDADAIWADRKIAMCRMLDDPLTWGYEPPSWKRADDAVAQFRQEHPVGVIICLISGGHRAGKTEYMAKRTVQNLFSKRDYKVWACQATQDASRDAQQSKIYKYLPPAYRVASGKLRHGRQVKVVNTPLGGFTEDCFAVQNIHGGTSECRFKFYSMNPRALEGSEIDMCWLDEEAPLDWLDAVIFRLVSRNGILFLTFTPRWGWTQTVKAVLSGAETLLETDADTDLLAVRDAQGNITAARKVPLLQRNLNVTVPGHKAKATIVYFPTSENPFPLGNWSNLKETLHGASEEKILTTAYGVPTKSMMAMFPLFKDNSHVISLERFREIQKGGGTWFMFLDPCSGRNWAMIWIFVDCLNRAFVAGESPSFGHAAAYIPGVGDPGPWAVPGDKADGEQGDGQKEFGWGFRRYFEEIDRMERLLRGGGDNGDSQEKIKIDARFIDARYGNARKTSEERSVTTIEELSELGMKFLAAPSEKVIDSGRGGGDGSIRMINDRLFYDSSREIDMTNQPHLYCVQTVPNTIFALKEWTGKDQGHGATKDWIDCLRMFVLSGSEYVDPAWMKPITPWLSQFGS